MVEMTNKELVKKIKAGNENFDSMVFLDSVHLRGEKFKRSLSFVASVFKKPIINFGDCTINGLNMACAQFDGIEELGVIYLNQSHLMKREICFCNHAKIYLVDTNINTKVYFPNDFFGKVILDGAFLGEKGQIFCGNNILLALKCFLYFGKNVHVDLDYKFDLGAFKELILSHCAK